MLLSSKIIKNDRAENSGQVDFEEIDYDFVKRETDNNLNVNIDTSKHVSNDEDVNGKINIDDLKQEIREEVLREINEEEERILNNAKKIAEKIIGESKELGFKEGYSEGKDEGYKEGLLKAKLESEDIILNARNILEDSEEEVREYFELNRENLIDLSITMAETIVNQKLNEDDENINNLIRPILESYSEVKRVVIRCNPKKTKSLNQNIKKLKEAYPEIRFFVVSDGNLEKNDIIIENDEQTVDLSIKGQLESMKKSIESVE